MKLIVSPGFKTMDDFIHSWSDKLSSSKMGMVGSRIGNILKESARANLVSQDAVRTGILRSSVNYKLVTAPGVIKISFGSNKSYAAMVEFGGTFTPAQIRAMFANFSRRGEPKRPSKGILRGNVYKSRPFLGPAIKDNRSRIIGILQDAAGPPK